MYNYFVSIWKGHDMRLFIFQIPIGASLCLFSGILSSISLTEHPEVELTWLFWIVIFGLASLLLVRGITNTIYAKNESRKITNLNPDRVIETN